MLVQTPFDMSKCQSLPQVLKNRCERFRLALTEQGMSAAKQRTAQHLLPELPPCFGFEDSRTYRPLEKLLTKLLGF